MMKGKKKRLLAGTLALLLSCSTLLNMKCYNKVVTEVANKI